VRSTTRESADTIATGFRTIFPRLQRPEVLDFLRSFNIELTEIGKNGEQVFVGPFEAIKRINAVISQLPTGDVRLAQIVEQIGGLRQFNKVLPLIQELPKAEKALAVARAGQDSLLRDSERAQESFAVQLTKVREEFLSLVRAVGEHTAFRSLLKLVL